MYCLDLRNQASQIVQLWWNDPVMLQTVINANNNWASSNSWHSSWEQGESSGELTKKRPLWYKLRITHMDYRLSLHCYVVERLWNFCLGFDFFTLKTWVSGLVWHRNMQNCWYVLREQRLIAQFALKYDHLVMILAMCGRRQGRAYLEIVWEGGGWTWFSGKFIGVRGLFLA